MFELSESSHYQMTPKKSCQLLVITVNFFWWKAGHKLPKFCDENSVAVTVFHTSINALLHAYCLENWRTAAKSLETPAFFMVWRSWAPPLPCRTYHSSTVACEKGSPHKQRTALHEHTVLVYWKHGIIWVEAREMAQRYRSSEKKKQVGSKHERRVSQHLKWG